MHEASSKIILFIHSIFIMASVPPQSCLLPAFLASTRSSALLLRKLQVFQRLLVSTTDSEHGIITKSSPE